MAVRAPVRPAHAHGAPRAAAGRDGQHAVLLEPEQDVFAHGAFDHLAEASAHQHKHPVVDHVASDVIQRLPRRRVRQDACRRAAPQEAALVRGSPARRSVLHEHGSAGRPTATTREAGRSSKNAAEVGDIPAAQAHHLVVGRCLRWLSKEPAQSPNGEAEPERWPRALSVRSGHDCAPKGPWRSGSCRPQVPVDHDAPERTPLGRAKRDGQRAHLCVPADERNRIRAAPPPQQSMAETTPTGRSCPYRMPYRYGSSLARRHQAGCN